MAVKDKNNYYDQWKKEYGFKSGTRGIKADFDFACKVRKKFDSAKNGRQNNCYWSTSTVSGNGSTSTGGDWNERWNLHDKIALMWSAMGAFANSQSNVKSPMTSGRLAAFMNQVKKLNFAYDVFPNNEKDIDAALVASKILQYVLKNTDSMNQLIMACEQSARYGSGFFRTVYIKDTVKYRFPKEKGFTPAEKERVQRGEVVYGEEEEKVLMDSPTQIFIPIRELYWDPAARTDHGESYAARYVVWRRLLPLDVAKDLLKDIPGVRNVDKIKPTSKFSNSYGDGFFEAPMDGTGSEYVEWLEIEDCREDIYGIVINDMTVLNTPMPAKHKEITFHKINYRDEPGQFYGKGIPDELLMIQGAEEIITNMATDYIYNSYRGKKIIGSSIAGEVTEAQLSGDASVIIVDDSPGEDLRSKIINIENSPIGFDLFRLFDIYERQATIASGFDPSQLAVLGAAKTATASLQNKEQAETTIQSVLKNYANGGFKTGGRQTWSLIKQNWKLPKIKKIAGESEIKSQPRTLRLDGIELVMGRDEKMEVRDNGIEYSFFKDLDDYLDTKEELTILVSADSMEIESKATDAQQARQDLAQLSAFMVDPENPMQMTQHPFPYIDGPKWIQNRMRALNLSKSELIKVEYGEEIALKTAEEHVMKILDGDNLPGMPGASAAHRKFEMQALFGLEAQLDEVTKEIDDQIMRASVMTQPEIDPMTGMEIPMPPPEADPLLVEKQKKLKDTWTRLSKHIVMENMPLGLSFQTAGKMPTEGMSQGGGGQASIPMPPSEPSAEASPVGEQISGGMATPMPQ